MSEIKEKTEVIFAAGKYGVVASEGEFAEALAALQMLLILDENQEVVKTHCIKAISVECGKKCIRRLIRNLKREKKFVRIFPVGYEKYIFIFSGDAFFCIRNAGIKESTEISFLHALFYVKKYAGKT